MDTYTTQCSNCGVSLGSLCTPKALCVQCQMKRCPWCHQEKSHQNPWPQIEYSEQAKAVLPNGRFDWICDTCYNTAYDDALGGEVNYGNTVASIY